MKERPILFKGEMVRAILDGNKTQTRRLVKPQPTMYEPGQCVDVSDMINDALVCPYGKPGDRLWVKETHRYLKDFDGDSPSRIAERCLDAGYSKPWAPIQYEADGERRNWSHTSTPPHDGPPEPGKTRVSIHMTQWASRILLEIVSVRVERLQAITQEDARAEGITDGGCSNCGEPEAKCKCDFPMPDPRDAYCHLWGQINGETGPNSWLHDPWVWVVEFRRVLP